MATSIGRIDLDLGINASGFKRQLNSVGKTAKAQTSAMSGMFGKLGTVIAATFAVKTIVDFSKSCIQLGSDLAEVQNVVDVTYGDMSNKVNQFAKDAMTSYGLSEKVAKQYMGTFGAMSKSFGYTTEAAYDQAAALTGLAGDVASFYNLTTDEAYTKLKSVFTGETESLKDLGVVMTQTALDEYALQKGMGKTTSQMSEQEKVALRLAFVQDRLATAAGDFERTSGGWANQTRVLSLRFDSLKATLGQGMINALTPLLPLINDIVAGLQRLADAFLDITVLMFGEEMAGQNSTMAQVSDATGTISNNMTNAAGSAKELKKVLAGFDKLNILSSSSDSGGSGGSVAAGGLELPGASGSGNGGGSGYDTTPLQNTLTEIGALVGTALLALGAIFTFTGVNIPLGIGLMVAGAGALGAAVAVDWTVITTNVATVIDLITTIVAGAALVVGAVLCFSGTNIPLGIALLAVGAVGIAGSVAMNWGAMTNEISTLITGITAGVSAAALALGIILLWAGVTIPLGIALIAVGAVGLVASVAPNWNAMTDSIGSTVSTIAAVVGGALLGLGAVLAFSGLFVGLGIALMGVGAVTLAAAVIPNWTGMSDEVKNVVAIITSIVGTAALAVGAVLAFTGINIPLGIALMAAGAVTLASAIAPNWEGLSDKTKKTITTITGIAGGAMLALGAILLCCGIVPLGLGLMVAGAGSLAAAITPNWNSIVKAVKDVFDKISDIADSCFKGIGNFFIGLLNGLIDALNSMIGTINKIPGVDLPKMKKVPKLANGGYVAANTPQLAIIGDNKREGEIVAPESKIAEAVARGFATVLSKLQGQNVAQKERPIYLTLQLGEDTFWEGFVDYHNDIVKRTGDSPLMI